MKRSKKHIAKSLTFFSTSLLWFLIAFIGITKQSVDLSRYGKAVGVVTDKGTAIRYGSKGREYEVFYIKLANMDEPASINRPSKDYIDLLYSINVGDTVTVYYDENENQNNAENANIDLVQVEGKGDILISKKEYEMSARPLIYVGLTTGIITIFLSYLHYKRRF